MTENLSLDRLVADARALIAAGEPDAAEALLQPYRDSGESRLRTALADAMAAQGRFMAGFSLLEADEAKNPADVAVAGAIAELLGRHVAPWHIPMMNDRPRAAAYRAAIDRLAPGRHVLEIGTGSGLLAMMAARAGAKSVTTCEAEPALEAIARQVIAANGFADKITVIGKRSDRIDPAIDLPAPAELVLSEIIANDLLSEAVLPALNDAQARLMAPGALMLPERGSFYIMPVAGDDLQAQAITGEIEGLDLSAFNRLAHRLRPLDMRGIAWEALGPPVESFGFDFRQHCPLFERRVIQMPVTKSGPLIGFIGWVKLVLADGIFFENPPAPAGQAPGPSGWMNVFYPLTKNRMVQAGEKLTVTVEHDGNMIMAALSP